MADVLNTQAEIAAAELALVKARLQVLEAAATNDWAKVKATLKSNFPHFVSWAGIGASLAHQFGWLKL